MKKPNIKTILPEVGAYIAKLERKLEQSRQGEKVERLNMRSACQQIARLTLALQSIRDTAIAMDDAVRTYPSTRTVICIEGPRRIKDAANKALSK